MPRNISIGTVGNGDYPQHPGLYGEGVSINIKRFDETYRLIIHDSQKISIITPYGERWEI